MQTRIGEVGRRGAPIAQPVSEPVVDLDLRLVELDEELRPSGDPLENAISIEDLDDLQPDGTIAPREHDPRDRWRGRRW